MAVLDFFLTPTAETARLKGCLTILLLDDIATKASRASGCEPELPVLQNLTAGRSCSHSASLRRPDSSTCTVPTAPQPSKQGARPGTAAIRSRILNRF